MCKFSIQYAYNIYIYLYIYIYIYNYKGMFIHKVERIALKDILLIPL